MLGSFRSAIGKWGASVLTASSYKCSQYIGRCLIKRSILTYTPIALFTVLLDQKEQGQWWTQQSKRRWRWHSTNIYKSLLECNQILPYNLALSTDDCLYETPRRQPVFSIASRCPLPTKLAMDKLAAAIEKLSWTLSGKSCKCYHGCPWFIIFFFFLLKH